MKVEYYFRGSKSDKDKCCISLICRIENMIQMNSITEQKMTHRSRKHMVTVGQRGRIVGQRGRLGIWDLQVHTFI